MQSPVPDIAPHLTATLAALRADGIEPSDAEVVWLARLRWVCDHPEDGSIPWVSGAPVQYGGVDFWPLHHLAEVWWMRAHKLLAGKETAQLAAYLFAHACSGVGDVSLRRITSSADIERAAVEWFDSLPIHEREIDPLMFRIMEIDGDRQTVPAPCKKANDDQDNGGDGTTFVAIMSKAFPGMSSEYWLTGVAASSARKMLIEQASKSTWANSPTFHSAVESYLNAVQWIRISRKETDGA